jgi:hypothetical protein
MREPHFDFVEHLRRCKESKRAVAENETSFFRFRKQQQKGGRYEK